MMVKKGYTLTGYGIGKNRILYISQTTGSLGAEGYFGRDWRVDAAVEKAPD